MADKYGRGSDLPTYRDEKGKPMGGGPYMPGTQFPAPYEFNKPPKESTDVQDLPINNIEHPEPGPRRKE